MSLQQKFSYTNDTAVDLRITIEPIAEQFVIRPGQQVDIEVHAEAPGTVEFMQTLEGLIVHGYWNCDLRVTSQGQELPPSEQV